VPNPLFCRKFIPVALVAFDIRYIMFFAHDGQTTTQILNIVLELALFKIIPNCGVSVPDQILKKKHLFFLEKLTIHVAYKRVSTKPSD